MAESGRDHQPEQGGDGRSKNRSLPRRIVLTVLIVGGVLVLMVLPMTLLFHAPERFAGLAASGIVVSVAMYLVLNRRRRLMYLRNQETDEE